MKVIALDERFWGKVNKDGPIPAHRPELGRCWVWTAAAGDAYGHGVFGIAREYRLEYAHRLTWAATFGDPGDLCVLHKCDNPRCVNVEHLFLGTRIDNNADKVAKNRQCRGSTRPMAKLTETDVVALRQAAAAGVPQKVLVEKYGVSSGKISRAITGLNWKHVATPPVRNRPSVKHLTVEQVAEIDSR